MGWSQTVPLVTAKSTILRSRKTSVPPAEEVEQGAGRQDQQDGQDNDGEDEIGQVESHEEDSFLCKVSLTLVG